MSTMDVNVKVSKESYELGQGVAGFVGAMSEALADGWQTTQDLPAAVQAAIGHLVPALSGSEKIMGEASEDTPAFIRAWTLAGVEVYEKLKSVKSG